MTAPGILQDQIDYYRARAAEYDEWWYRGGRYDRGAEQNARWHADTAAVDAALVDWLGKHCPPNVLRLACGTGLFTPPPRATHGSCHRNRRVVRGVGHQPRACRRRQRGVCPGRSFHLATTGAIR